MNDSQILSYNVGYYAEQQPFIYINPLGGVDGISIDFLKSISDELNVKFVFFPVFDSSDLKRADILINFGNLKDSTKFVEKIPYYTLNMLLIKIEAGNDKVASVKSEKGFISESYSGDVDFYAEDLGHLYNVVSLGLYGKVILSSITSESFISLLNIDEYSMKKIESDIAVKIYLSSNLDKDVLNKIHMYMSEYKNESLDISVMKHSNVFQRKILIEHWEERSVFLTAISILVVMILIVITFTLTIKFLKEKDPLTKGYNKVRFLKDAINFIDNNRASTPCILSIDVDGFSDFNKLFGYKKGDELLKFVNIELRSEFSDSGYVSRFYDDCFMIFVKHHNDDVNEKLKEYFTTLLPGKIATHFTECNDVNFSSGLYVLKRSDGGADHVVDNAVDNAVDARLIGKGSYDNSFFIYDEQAEISSTTKIKIESGMRSALELGEFAIVLQPKFNLNCLGTVGAEVLIRWNENGSFKYSPDQFIPIFEKNKFIKNIDEFVFLEACKFLQEMKALCINALPLSINISYVTLLESDLVLRMPSIVKLFGLDCSDVELEITETAISSDYDLAKSRIQYLNEFGFSVSIDDFGSGSSSLNRLRHLDFDTLKLDREFINSLTMNKQGISIIKSVVMLSKDLGLTTVAEGIETEEQLELLKLLGCDIGQGYYYAKPMSKSEFISFIQAEFNK